LVAPGLLKPPLARQPSGNTRILFEAGRRVKRHGSSRRAILADYWLTFRIAEDGHPDRYDSLIEAANALGTGFWDGPTSFICMRSAHSIDTIGQRLKAEINTRRDLLLIREIGRDSTRYAGDPGDGFSAFFPNAKKL
jgi:hypothetical protein